MKSAGRGIFTQRDVRADVQNVTAGGTTNPVSVAIFMFHKVGPYAHSPFWVSAASGDGGSGRIDDRHAKCRRRSLGRDRILGCAPGRQVAESLPWDSSG